MAAGHGPEGARVPSTASEAVRCFARGTRASRQGWTLTLLEVIFHLGRLVGDLLQSPPLGPDSPQDLLALDGSVVTVAV